MAKADDPFVAKVLKGVLVEFDGVDNGICQVCHIGHRLYNHRKRQPDPCENQDCFSHSLTDALKTYKAEREMLIYWLLQAYETLCRSGYEEGRTDDEMRHDLISVLANLGYEPNESKAAEELKARQPAYYTERAKELWLTAGKAR